MFRTIFEFIGSFITSTLYGGIVKVEGNWYFLTDVSANDDSILAYRTKVDVFDEIEYITNKLNRFNKRVEAISIIKLNPRNQSIYVPDIADVGFDDDTNSFILNPITKIVTMH